MERLTMWYDGNQAICENEECSLSDCPFADPICEQVQNVIDRLAAIEDILGDDYDLDRLRELVQADRAKEGWIESSSKHPFEEPAARLGLEIDGWAFRKILKENHTTAERVVELAEADKDGRCVALPVRGYTDKDGEQALNSAMNTCFYHNNPVTRYIADAVAEKLTREAAEAALRREQE